MIDEKRCLAERYQLEKQICRNAVGNTYAAWDMVKNCKAVVKELVSSQVAVYTALKQFSPLDGIVDVYDVFEEDGTTYAAMEYVDGVTIEDYLKKSNGKFKVNRIKDLLNPVLCSLIKLYQEGISHGNISADKFIFTNEGKLKLIGFSYVSISVSDKEKAYIPVELLEGEDGANESSDIYSLSVFIYRCITGIMPQEAFERRYNDTCQKPSEIGAEISSNDESALLMGMSVDVKKRLFKMAAFYRAFYGTPAPIFDTNTAKQSAENIPVSVSGSQPKEQKNDDKIQDIHAIEDDKTEIINNNSLIQVTDRPVFENNIPIMADIQPDNSPSKDSKKRKRGKKKGNGLLIIIIVIGTIVAIALGIITFRLVLEDMESAEEKTGEKISGDEETDNIELGREIDTEDSINTMISEGRYEDVIQAILDANLDESEGADNLQKSIDKLYSQCINETSALADNGQFDTAFSIIDEKIQYFADIADKTGYVKDKHEYDLTEQKYRLTQAYIEYMYETAQTCVNNRDENGMLEALNNMSAYVSADEVKKKKEDLYTKLVLATMSGMSASGESSNSIMQYIDNNLEKTGNNCRLIEFWDYYDDLYHKQLNRDRMTVTKIRVSGAGYILPESNTRALSYSDINVLTEYELYFALFEIYARHDRIFSDSAVSSHFQKYSWYNGSITPENFDESVLSDIEKQNIDTIINYQRDMGYR